MGIVSLNARETLTIWTFYSIRCKKHDNCGWHTRVPYKILLFVSFFSFFSYHHIKSGLTLFRIVFYYIYHNHQNTWVVNWTMIRNVWKLETSRLPNIFSSANIIIYLFLQSCTNPHPSIYLSTTLYVDSAKYLFFTVSLQFKKKCVLFKEPQHTTSTSRAYAQLYKLWRLQFSSNTNSDIRVSPLGWNRIYQSLGCRSITLKFLTTYTKLKIVFAFQSVMI